MEIGKLHKSLGATMVYVTHDQVEAMTLADKIVVLKDGYVQQIGAPMEAKPGSAPTSSPSSPPANPRGTAAGSTAKLGVRPQDLKPVEEGGIVNGHVTLVERLGTETVIDIALPDGGRVLSSLGEDVIFEPGQAISLGFAPERAHLFAAE